MNYIEDILFAKFLEKVFPDYEIPYTSNNSEPKGNSTHNRYYYTLENRTAPDLLVAKNYIYENLNTKPVIYAALEVKQQASTEMFNKEIKKYSIHLIQKLATYLCVNNKVILTNCRRWQFFDRTNNVFLVKNILKTFR